MKFEISLTDKVLPGADSFTLRLPSGLRRGFRRVAIKGGAPKATKHEVDLSVQDARGLAVDGYAVKPDPFDQKAVEAAAKKEK